MLAVSTILLRAIFSQDDSSENDPSEDDLLGDDPSEEL